MKIAKKVLAFLLCALMIITTMLNEGSVSLVQSLKASAIAGQEQNYNDARVELDFNKGWNFALCEDSSAYLKGFDDSDWDKVYDSVLRTMLQSHSDLVIFPIQDLLAYGADTRLNRPGTAENNWKYRVEASQFDEIDYQKLAYFNRLYKR
jgi:4-alpha-glucanotransferase